MVCVSRLVLLYIMAVGYRMKYYFAWSVSEASLVFSGFSFQGWTASSPSQPLWYDIKLRKYREELLAPY
jgi:hypothetical protein